MIATIQKWGNSLGIRIPKATAADARVAEGSRVDLKVENHRLVITPIRSTGYDLRELVDGITPENQHGEEDFGAAVGREAW